MFICSYHNPEVSILLRDPFAPLQLGLIVGMNNFQPAIIRPSNVGGIVINCASRMRVRGCANLAPGRVRVSLNSISRCLVPIKGYTFILRRKIRRVTTGNKGYPLPLNASPSKLVSNFLALICPGIKVWPFPRQRRLLFLQHCMTS